MIRRNRSHAQGAALPIVAVWDCAPTHGPASGGPVTIHGVNFTGATAVTFDGHAAADVVVVDDNTITCDAPPGAPGVVQVAVTAPDGTGSAAAYSYDPFHMADLNLPWWLKGGTFDNTLPTWASTASAAPVAFDFDAKPGGVPALYGAAVNGAKPALFDGSSRFMHFASQDNAEVAMGAATPGGALTLTFGLLLKVHAITSDAGDPAQNDCAFAVGPAAVDLAVAFRQTGPAILGGAVSHSGQETTSEAVALDSWRAVFFQIETDGVTGAFRFKVGAEAWQELPFDRMINSVQLAQRAILGANLWWGTAWNGQLMEFFGTGDVLSVGTCDLIRGEWNTRFPAMGGV